MKKNVPCVWLEAEAEESSIQMAEIQLADPEDPDVKSALARPSPAANQDPSDPMSADATVKRPNLGFSYST
ncbi:unnamed protein product [Haemonchus placei]|uniref:Uncharacterized protein n=1 Tax=Haemonchus placei TaxID=6290 RepID=A0A0N4WMM2_HAEPC|nr:unnamed protein product [Haemonchus placei]